MISKSFNLVGDMLYLLILVIFFVFVKSYFIWYEKCISNHFQRNQLVFFLFYVFTCAVFTFIT